ncbi:MAG: HAD-IIIA family hydrolase [candidate division KSB1 bacterium]|nr:HAD-IIIA family hydrolase [candidate division KSB1 bacterium]MDZ7359019.1 HAD-IIIA family hydrolase [candidate division KSB1 bacterium]MDZ7377521.1 HAD-IIIA family hydrolase [candidate division KSB1 bacterium]MDZ7400018.1 HAD-IIIA family hydrolase [candidate division KSB1 bacterium]
MIAQKITTRDELVLICDQMRREGRVIGFTSGAFDLLHAGHVDFLEQARAQCDRLIVGINSDASIQKYKGPTRPIISERLRLKTVAALESVDYVFLFDERRNAKNIELLKPHIYFKAGDYTAEQLSSKPLMEQIGGEVRLIPVNEPISTTAIIERIQLQGDGDRFVEEQERTVHLKLKPTKMRPAVFLDRDGTINREIGYLSEPEQFEFLPNALHGLKKMQDLGYRLVIVTNQGGIGLGYFTKEDFYRVNKKMLAEVSRAGILIDKIYFCPHSKADNCPCRKPELGLIERAKEELNLDLSHSFFIGDSEIDIETGVRAGMKTILIENERVPALESMSPKPDFIVKDLLEAAETILKLERE